MNAKEYNQCVDQHADHLYRFALKHMGDSDEADEIVQQGFLKLWEKHGEVPAEKAKSYLFTTAWRLILDTKAKQARKTELNEQVMQMPADNTPQPDLKKVIEDALQKLPDIQRSIVMLRDYEGYSYEEIGTITGLNESQVKVYLFRARQTMKKYLVNLEVVL